METKPSDVTSHARPEGDELVRVFGRQFGGRPTIAAKAPGRVNLAGEHTDYNDGFVLPVAIDRGVFVAARGTGSTSITFYSMAHDQFASFPAEDPAAPRLPSWARYAQGVAQQLTRAGVGLAGIEAAVGGDLPMGAGLGSSAALELATVLALEASAGTLRSPRENALLSWQAEVDFVGVPCGIMDQFASALGRRGHALFIDCRSLETRPIPLPSEWVIAVCDTGVRRALNESAYAQRRAECLRAVAALHERGLPVRSLRDVTDSQWPSVEALPEPLRRRARHVIRENRRVGETVELLRRGDAPGLRRVFLESQASLRDDYEVSSIQLDAMVEAALAAPGCIAARMTGAGFGGAAVALVHRREQESFLDFVGEDYRRRTGLAGSFFVAESADGAGRLT